MYNFGKVVGEESVCVIEQKIATLRVELGKLMTENEPRYEEVYRLSVQLDELINEYYMVYQEEKCYT